MAYRIDWFYSGKHTKKYFETYEQAVNYGVGVKERLGCPVFILAKYNSVDAYDVIGEI